MEKSEFPYSVLVKFLFPLCKLHEEGKKDEIVHRNKRAKKQRQS